jgi:PAS domain S-box-containing protein
MRRRAVSLLRIREALLYMPDAIDGSRPDQGTGRGFPNDPAAGPTDSHLRQEDVQGIRNTLFMELPEPVLVWDLRTGAVLDCNDAFEACFGYGRGEIVGKPLQETGLWLDGEGRDLFMGGARFPGSCKHLEVSLRTRCGRVIPVELSATQADLPAGPAVVCALHDMTVSETARRALRDSEEHFRSAIEHTGAGYFLLGPRGTLEYVNQAFAEITGCPRPGALLGRPFHSLFLPPDDEHARAFAAGGLAGRHDPDAVLTVHHPDGMARTLRLTMAPLHRDDALPWAHGFALDITRQLEAEEQLRASEARWKALVTHAPDLILHLGRRGKVTFVNQVPVGMRVEDVIGKTAFRLIPPASRKQVGRCVRGVFETGVSDYFEVEATGPLGSPVWYAARVGPVERGGRVDAVILIARDITARKEVEQALQESEQRYRMLFSTMQDGFCLTRVLAGPDGSITDCRLIEVNAAFESLLEKTRAELLGRTLGSLLPRLMEEGERLWPLVLHAGQSARFTHSAPNLGKDLEVVAYCPRPEHLAFLITNVTERKKAEEERRRLAERMQQAHKMESLGVMAGGIAHDFNNLLMGVLGNAELADTPDDIRRRACLQALRQAAQRAADLTRQILAYTGQSLWRPTRLDLSEELRAMRPVLTGEAPPGAELVFALEDRLPLVAGDGGQLCQLITNLVTNAVESLGDQPGSVHVSTGRTNVSSSYLARTYMDDDLPGGEYVFLEVKDTGCGMDTETIRRMSDPFFTTKFTGRGLGLAAAVGIIRAHRGALKVKSAVGKGSTITVLLPSATALSEDTAIPTERPVRREAVSHRPVVLVADPDAITRRTVKTHLMAAGYEVLEGAEAGAVARLCQEEQHTLRCMLLDAGIAADMGSAMDEGLLNGIRAILTGTAEIGEIRRSQKTAGFTTYLKKPFSPGELIEVVQAVGGAVQL